MKSAKKLTLLFFLLNIHFNKKSNFGRTALMVASKEGRKAAAKILLEKGADVDMEAISGWTPLMTAALKGHLGMVKLLLSYRAYPSARVKRAGQGLWQSLRMSTQE